MEQLRKRWLLLLVLALFVAGPIAWYKWSGPAAAGDEAAVMATVKEGSFHVTVTTTGELRELSSLIDSFNAQPSEAARMRRS